MGSTRPLPTGKSRLAPTIRCVWTTPTIPYGPGCSLAEHSLEASPLTTSMSARTGTAVAPCQLPQHLIMCITPSTNSRRAVARGVRHLYVQHGANPRLLRHDSQQFGDLEAQLHLETADVPENPTDRHERASISYRQEARLRQSDAYRQERCRSARRTTQARTWLQSSARRSRRCSDAVSAWRN